MTQTHSLQKELLLAAFAAPALALPAWAHWQSSSGWEDHVDFDAYLLLPQVFHNLGGRGVDDALFTRLKGVVKRNWAANAATLAAIGRIVGLLRTSGVECVLLPPHSLLLRDRSVALEAGAPITLRIARRDTRQVVAVLDGAGWFSSIAGVPRWSLPGYIAAASRIDLRNREHQRLDLLWDNDPLFAEDSGGYRDLNGVAIRIPAARSSVRFLLEGAGQGSEFCRLARALMLLEKAPDAHGWRCLLQQSQQRGSPFLDLVTELSRAGAAPAAGCGVDAAPDTAADNAPDTSPDTSPSSASQATAVAPQRLSFRARLAIPWRHYRGALGEESSLAQALCCLPGYLMGKWQLRRAGELLPAVYRSLRYHWRQRRTDDAGQSR